MCSCVLVMPFEPMDRKRLSADVCLDETFSPATNETCSADSVDSVVRLLRVLVSDEIR